MDGEAYKATTYHTVRISGAFSIDQAMKSATERAGNLAYPMSRRT